MARSLEYIQAELIRVADEQGIRDPRSPSFTRTIFLKHTDVTRHDLDSHGGFARLKVDAANTYGILPDIVQPDTRGLELRNSYVRRLERAVATGDYLHDRILSSLESLFTRNPIRLSTIKYPARSKTSKKAKPHILSLLWSDLHFGIDVKPEETLGANYTWVIASRRLAKLCVEAVQWKQPNTSLRIYLNGDIMEGVIHLDDSNVKPMTEQIWGTVSILTAAVDFLRQHFNDISVICLPGNHDRMVYRNSQRNTTQRWDSHASSVFLALRMAFRATDVRFDIPTSGISLLDDLNGGYILAAHGDTEPNPKNVSKSIDTESLSNRFLKMKDSSVVDRHISVGLFGHWHTPTIQMLPSGSFMVVNGCLIGSSPFGQNVIGEYNNTPAQIMFDSVPGSPFHRHCIVTVRDADQDSSLDKVIPTPRIKDKGQLVA